MPNSELAEQCDHAVSSYDINEGWHRLRCDRPAGHEGPHQAARIILGGDE